jgi:acetyl-CoA C-acetyltransferase
MSGRKAQAYIVGAYEHPLRLAPDKSVAQLHAEVAKGALDDAGLRKEDVDGYFCAGDAPGVGALSMVDYLNINPRHIDTTETGGSSYLMHVAHATQAIMAGKCRVALITLAGRPRSELSGGGTIPRLIKPDQPDTEWEFPYDTPVVSLYAMVAMRHMYQFGTTAQQLAWVRVAASHHAKHNPNAVMKETVSVADVLSSPMISDPLHRLDCCVVSDGGGALVVVCEEVAKQLRRPLVRVIGYGEYIKGQDAGRIDLTSTASVRSGAEAFAQARVMPKDIKYASIYDSFTISVLLQLEDLGFCQKGQGGAFVADGNLISGIGKLPINTDGGGLCNNHPANRGGITKVIEAVRQLRNEAHPAVQVPNCDLALAHGTGGSMATRHGSATLILERE